MPEISLETVSVFRGKSEVLKNLSLAIDSPLTCIVGANGSGKSTLMQSFTGLVSFAGQIRVNGKDIGRLSQKERAQMMAFVPQLFSNLPNITVHDYIRLGRFPHLPWLGQFSAQDRETTLRQIVRLGVGHLLEKKVSRISGGELRKVAIARALTQASPILLMDEPLQGLDPFQRKDFFDLTASLLTEGKMLVVVSHEEELLNKLKPDILALRDGKVWFRGPYENLPAKWIEDLYAPQERKG